MTDYTPEALEALCQSVDRGEMPSFDTVSAVAGLYRTGQLILAQPSVGITERQSETLHKALLASYDSMVPSMPSADEVEAVKAGLRKCFDSERPGDDEDKALTLLANAAITAYEAASGVAKMRDALGEKP